MQASAIAASIILPLTAQFASVANAESNSGDTSCGKFTSSDVYNTWTDVPSSSEGGTENYILNHAVGPLGDCANADQPWAQKGDFVVKKSAGGGVCWVTLGKYDSSARTYTKC